MHRQIYRFLLQQHLQLEFARILLPGGYFGDA